MDSRVFQLMRQDNNGNKYILREGPDKLLLERMKEVFEENPHKNIFWVEEKQNA